MSDTLTDETLGSLTETLLAAAKRAGADGADALAVRGTSLSIDVRGGALEQAERSEGVDIGLRVLVGQRQAVVSASDTSAQTIETIAERAVAMAVQAPEDAHIRQAQAGEFARDWDVEALDLVDPEKEPDPATLQALASEAEATALSVDGISQVPGASSAYGARGIHLATSEGFSGGYSRTSHALSCVAIAGEGLEMERDYDGDMRSHRGDMRSAREIGETAAARALERSGARKPPTGAFPVVYDERISSGLIGHLLAAINGASVARGSSWLADGLGTSVLPDGLDLIEDPLRPRVTGSRPFDAEGLATEARTIVSDGVLTGWTLDLASAHQLGMTSTASAARGTSSGPSPSVTNVALTQGAVSRDALLSDMGTGLLITSMIGSSINPTTGDYSRGASGFWVENGQISYPVNECTVAGNLRDMLRRITPANDARPHLSRVVPSLLVEGMTLAGE